MLERNSIPPDQVVEGIIGQLKKRIETELREKVKTTDLGVVLHVDINRPWVNTWSDPSARGNSGITSEAYQMLIDELKTIYSVELNEASHRLSRRPTSTERAMQKAKVNELNKWGN